MPKKIMLSESQLLSVIKEISLKVIREMSGDSYDDIDAEENPMEEEMPTSRQLSIAFESPENDDANDSTVRNKQAIAEDNGRKNVLIACEESQRSCMEFRKLGFNAFSCDLYASSGGHPEWHVKGDCLPLLDGNCTFQTEDGQQHTIRGKWDLIIAHPPCTYLTVTGNRWFNVERYGDKALERYAKRDEAFEFLMKFANAKCDHICIENPVGYPSTAYRKPDQIIQPFWFGDPYAKATCLWLKGLRPLEKTNVVKPEEPYVYKNGKKDSLWHMETMKLPADERSKARSKTFPGIAKAFAEQFGSQI